MRPLRVAFAVLSAMSFAACLLDVDESLVDRAKQDGGGAQPGDAAKTDGGKPCVGREYGLYCGRSLPSYVGGPQDLVRCMPDGAIGQVFDCPTGCAPMPTGRQDMCDPCDGDPDASYCAQQLSPSYKHDDVLVTCANGKIASARICAAGCAPTGSTGACN